MPSTLAAEALAMRDALDDAIYLGSIMTELYCNNYHVNELPVVAYTDKKSLGTGSFEIREGGLDDLGGES